MATLWLVLWLAPVVAALLLVARLGTNVVYGDDLAHGVFLTGAAAHGLRWADLIAQHNESRLLTLRLLDLAVTGGGRWPFDVRRLMVASVLTAAFTGAMTYRLARRTFGPGPTAGVVAVAANALLLLPSQWMNLLWGIQWIVFVPTAALTVGLVALGGRRPFAFAVAAAAAAFATFTNSNGFLVWPLLLPAVLMRRSPRPAWAAAAAWVAMAGLTVGYYLHGYVPPPGHASYRTALAHPATSVTFVLAFVGNGLRITDDPHRAAGVGLVAVVLAAAAGGLVLTGDRRRDAVPWLTLAAYAVASGGVAAAGRSALGLGAALPPRYVTFALPLYVALVPLWLLAGQAWSRRWTERWTARPAWSALPAGLVAVWVAALAVRSCRSVRGERDHYVAVRRTALALVQWLPVTTDEPALVRYVAPQVGPVRGVVGDLRRFGLLPPGQTTDDLRPLIATAAGGPDAVGQLDPLTRVGDELHASGWATLHGRPGRSADAVLLTMVDPAGTPRVVALTGDVHRRGPHGRDGWAASVPGARVPPGSALSAYAYDATDGRAYRLGSRPK